MNRQKIDGGRVNDELREDIGRMDMDEEDEWVRDVRKFDER